MDAPLPKVKGDQMDVRWAITGWTIDWTKWPPNNVERILRIFFSRFKTIIGIEFWSLSECFKVRFGQWHFPSHPLAISYASYPKRQTLSLKDSDIQCNVKNLHLRCQCPLTIEIWSRDGQKGHLSLASIKDAGHQYDFFKSMVKQYVGRSFLT